MRQQYGRSLVVRSDGSHKSQLSSVFHSKRRAVNGYTISFNLLRNRRCTAATILALSSAKFTDNLGHVTRAIGRSRGQRLITGQRV